MNSLLAILVPFLLVSIVLSNPVERQKRQDAAEVNVCGRYEQPIQNPRGETRCIPKPGSCAGSPDFVHINCFVSPCLTFKQRCPQASTCYTDACNACKARIYDINYNEICTSGPFFKYQRGSGN